MCGLYWIVLRKVEVRVGFILVEKVFLNECFKVIGFTVIFSFSEPVTLEEAFKKYRAHSPIGLYLPGLID